MASRHCSHFFNVCFPVELYLKCTISINLKLHTTVCTWFTISIKKIKIKSSLFKKKKFSYHVNSTYQFLLSRAWSNSSIVGSYINKDEKLNNWSTFYQDSIEIHFDMTLKTYFKQIEQLKLCVRLWGGPTQSMVYRGWIFMVWMWFWTYFVGLSTFGLGEEVHESVGT